MVDGGEVSGDFWRQLLIVGGATFWCGIITGVCDDLWQWMLWSVEDVFLPRDRSGAVAGRGRVLVDLQRLGEGVDTLLLAALLAEVDGDEAVLRGELVCPGGGGVRPGGGHQVRLEAVAPVGHRHETPATGHRGPGGGGGRGWYREWCLYRRWSLYREWCLYR